MGETVEGVGSARENMKAHGFAGFLVRALTAMSITGLLLEAAGAVTGLNPEGPCSERAGMAIFPLAVGGMMGAVVIVVSLAAWRKRRPHGAKLALVLGAAAFLIPIVTVAAAVMTARRAGSPF